MLALLHFKKETDLEDPALLLESKQHKQSSDPFSHSTDTTSTGSTACSSTTTSCSSRCKSGDSGSAVATDRVALSEDRLIQISAAKVHLKDMLAKHNRSAKHPEVAKAVEVLSALNPTEDAALSPHFEGTFVSLTRPEFPGRIKQEKENEHLDQFTLGRMSFNIFQPKDLVCTITGTRNILKRSLQEEDKADGDDSSHTGRTFSYPLETHMLIHSPKGDFPAALQMEAFCSSAKQPKNRLGVAFIGGKMVPGVEIRSDPNKLALWKEVFADAYKKADAERSYLSRLMLFFFQWMFQLTTPTDKEAEQNADSSVHFEMKRCPHGYIDILYLDEDLRITRGNRGTIVIVERANQ